MQPARDRRDVFASGMGQARSALEAVSALERDRALSARPLVASSGYAIELLAIGCAYFVFAKIGLALASIHPSASPIWPPTGLALAVRHAPRIPGLPAIFLGAWLANATTAGSIATSSAIALGNTLESLVGG